MKKQSSDSQVGSYLRTTFCKGRGLAKRLPLRLAFVAALCGAGGVKEISASGVKLGTRRGSVGAWVPVIDMSLYNRSIKSKYDNRCPKPVGVLPVTEHDVIAESTGKEGVINHAMDGVEVFTPKQSILNRLRYRDVQGLLHFASAQIVHTSAWNRNIEAAIRIILQPDINHWNDTNWRGQVGARASKDKERASANILEAGFNGRKINGYPTAVVVHHSALGTHVSIHTLFRVLVGITRELYGLIGLGHLAAYEEEPQPNTDHSEEGEHVSGVTHKLTWPPPPFTVFLLCIAVAVAVIIVACPRCHSENYKNGQYQPPRPSRKSHGTKLRVWAIVAVCGGIASAHASWPFAEVEVDRNIEGVPLIGYPNHPSRVNIGRKRKASEILSSHGPVLKDHADHHPPGVGRDGLKGKRNTPFHTDICYASSTDLPSTWYRLTHGGAELKWPRYKGNVLRPWRQVGIDYPFAHDLQWATANILHNEMEFPTIVFALYNPEALNVKHASFSPYELVDTSLGFISGVFSGLCGAVGNFVSMLGAYDLLVDAPKGNETNQGGYGCPKGVSLFQCVTEERAKPRLWEIVAVVFAILFGMGVVYVVSRKLDVGDEQDHEKGYTSPSNGPNHPGNK